ncbi:(2Fe-2S)-binding protein [Nocardioides yefusunii]|uniref:(2Fe-2S)-binding protein n=1 Tax=Nocardioides yefusunii TaxID=2500546 RepID=A0ABW1QZN4_9ACTN|nr:(2Fe-2S)-binding protein [Nocardioides yefusunii]
MNEHHASATQQPPRPQPYGPWFGVARFGVAEFRSAPGRDEGWLTFDEFCSDAWLDALVDDAHARLAVRGPLGRTASDLRAVASTVVLGLFSRAVSPAVGTEVAGQHSAAPHFAGLTGYVADPATTFWRPARPGEGGPGEIATTAPVGPGAGAGSGVSSAEEVLERICVPLADAFAARFGVPEKVLRGNLAAAVLGTHDVVRSTTPQLTQRSGAVVSRVLAHPLLTGTLEQTPRGIMRTSCCQIHRLPVGFVCGNCPLVAADTTTARRLRG